MVIKKNQISIVKKLRIRDLKIKRIRVLMNKKKGPENKNAIQDKSKNS